MRKLDKKKLEEYKKRADERRQREKERDIAIEGALKEMSALDVKEGRVE